jgi:hypothetical protein
LKTRGECKSEEGIRGEEQTLKGWPARTIVRLRSQLNWKDLVAGIGAAILIAAIVQGLHFDSLPDLKPGDIAGQDVCAAQFFIYEANKRPSDAVSCP